MKAIPAALGLSLLLAATAHAENDVTRGKTLHDKTCVACHASRFGDDGSKMYTRTDHKVTSKAQLAARIKSCNANIGANLFPEEEAHLEAYLNATYYHLK